MIGNHNVCKELFKWSAWNAKLMYVHVLNIYENDNKTLSNPFTMYSVFFIYSGPPGTCTNFFHIL